MDPAALGTLMIGLDSVRLDQELDESEPTAARRRRLADRRERHPVVRHAVAVGLHRIADMLEPAHRAGAGQTIAVGG
jgi:hypothetical protein